jgi:hypothetical protein
MLDHVHIVVILASLTLAALVAAGWRHPRIFAMRTRNERIFAASARAARGSGATEPAAPAARSATSTGFDVRATLC